MITQLRKIMKMFQRQWVCKDNRLQFMNHSEDDELEFLDSFV